MGLLFSKKLNKVNLNFVSKRLKGVWYCGNYIYLWT
jgi:hypothetical protein